MTRGVEAPRLAERAPRGRRRLEVMKRRTAGVEHPWGTMPRGGDHRSGLMRGREQDRTEGRMTVWADHLRRGLTRGERPRLLATLG